MALEVIDPAAVNVEANGKRARLAKSKRHGQPDITKAYDPDLATNTL